jgi:C_GCAxxG_C_C family probable redox protein
MKSKSEIASEMLISGFNCAQSVLAVFCEDYGLDKEKALKLSSGMGGGCSLGEICGVVMGAVMVIGLKYGRHKVDGIDIKGNCDAKVAKFMEEFKAEHGHVVCRDLLGYDVSTKEGKAKIRAADRATSPCNGFVRSAVEILEKLGY